MFETFSKEFIDYLASINIYEIKLPEELTEMLEADTGKGIAIEEQVNREVKSYGICKCGTLYLVKDLRNYNCPLCFTPYNPIKKGIKNKEFMFKYKNTKTFTANKEKCSILVNEGAPIFEVIKKENNKYELSVVKAKKQNVKEIKLSNDGSHLNDFSIYKFINELSDKHTIAFVNKMNEIVDNKYKIIVNKSMTNYLSNVRIVAMQQMYFETIRTIQQYLGVRVPFSFFVEDNTIISPKEEYYVKLEKGAISLNDSEINPNKKKINQILGLPKVLIDDFMKSIDEKNFYLELYKFHNVKDFYETVSNKDVQLTQTYIEYKMHYPTNSNYLLNTMKSEHNHDLKALMRYIIKIHKEEKLSVYETINSYVDYLNMCSQMNLKPKKYPNNLMLVHDVMAKDFKIVQDEKSRELFNKTYKELNDDYTHIDMNHIYLQPLTIQALVEEGNQLHHCIASYGKKVIENESLIYFMRKSYEPDVPYITVEIVNKTVVEARGSFNRIPNRKELNYIKSWAKLKSLNFDDSLI